MRELSDSISSPQALTGLLSYPGGRLIIGATTDGHGLTKGSGREGGNTMKVSGGKRAIVAAKCSGCGRVGNSVITVLPGSELENIRQPISVLCPDCDPSETKSLGYRSEIGLKGQRKDTGHPLTVGYLYGQVGHDPRKGILT